MFTCNCAKRLKRSQTLLMTKIPVLLNTPLPFWMASASVQTADSVTLHNDFHCSFNKLHLYSNWFSMTVPESIWQILSFIQSVPGQPRTEFDVKTCILITVFNSAGCVVFFYLLLFFIFSSIQLCFSLPYLLKSCTSSFKGYISYKAVFQW